MKFKLSMYIASFILFAAVPTALASTTWYVDGVSGSDNNDCKTPTTACKTIGHAISLAGSRDTISGRGRDLSRKSDHRCQLEHARCERCDHDY